jgi:integrase/recombinase XerD
VVREALITTARLSGNINDFSLVALLGLLVRRIFEACGSNVADLGDEHGHREPSRASASPKSGYSLIP